MRSGNVRTRSRELYRPRTIRGYERGLGDRVLPGLGSKRLGDHQRRDVQRLADELLGEGPEPSMVRNVLMPLGVIYRRAIEDGGLAVNPTGHFRHPACQSPT